jgi:competence protein CoiA
MRGDCMFIAKLKSGKIISILHSSEEVIDELKKKGPFYCPSCKQELILKRGKLKMAHFAHKTTCIIKPEGETESHLLGKKKLFHWLQRQGFHPRLEAYISEFKQRPDLLFKWKERQAVIEFQCSVIPSEEILKRTSTYLKHHFYPIWIIHDSLLRKSSFTIHLNHFISQLIFHKKNKAAIISFHPQNEEFIVYQSIIPFSTNRALTIANKYSFNETFDTIFEIKPRRVNFLPYWITVSESWLIQRSILPGARKNRFLQFLYQRNLHPINLPWEIGIPLPQMHLVETPPFEWQFYIWYFFLYTKNIGTVIQKDELSRCMFHKLNQYVRFRPYPFITAREKFQPFENYVSFLTSLGFFKVMGDKLIVKQKPKLLSNGSIDRKRRKQAYYFKNKERILRFFYLTD